MDNTPQYRGSSGRSIFGILILGFGVLLLLHHMDFPIPRWIFTFPFFLVVLGLALEVRSGFKSKSALVAILIGAYLLARHQGWIAFSIGTYFWPALLIIAGLLIMVRPRNRRFNSGGYASDNADGSDVFDSVAVFWGARRTILSKRFSKGDIVNVFGGTEINFMQADISETAVVDVVAVFGGVKLIVPSDWDVRVNVVHIFAGTDDKRKFHSASPSKKILLVNGAAIFGGIDISSY